MQINQRFQDKLIASTALDVTLVPGLNAVANGPIIAAAGLDKIAERVKTDLNVTGVSTSHARPSMLASISSFATNVQDALDAVNDATKYAALSDSAKRDFTEWQGMIAAVALCNIYSGVGLDLSVDVVHLDGKKLVERCVLLEMAKDPNYRSAITQGTLDNPQAGVLYYICQDKKPFAIYHPAVGLCAMKDYDASMFDGILTWQRSCERGCHEGWMSVMDPDGTTMLDDFCLCRIAWWARQNGMMTYGNYIQSRQADPTHVPNPGLGFPGSILNAPNIDSIWEGRGTAFGTAMMFFRDAEGTARSMPELFMENMLISYMGGADKNRMIYNSTKGEQPICFRGNPPELADFAPVAPLRESVMELLETGSLEELNFDAESNLDMATNRAIINSVTVELVLTTRDGETFRIHRRYDTAHLRQGKLPYLMVWPFVPMPKGMNLWKNYYATWTNQSGSFRPLLDRDGNTIQMADRMSYNFGTQGTARNVYRPTAPTEYWTVCTGSSMFRYAVLTSRRDDEDFEGTGMGMVFVPELHGYTATFGNSFFVNNPGDVKLAIDFGTTSTVCALSAPFLNQGNEIPLPFRDYSRAVTCENAAAKKQLDSEHWLGNVSGGEDWKWDQKIFSVAQLFDRQDGTGPSRSMIPAAGSQEFYVDGRLFLVSGAAMTNYVSSAQASLDPLLAQQIMNDMKFNETLDIRNYQAASVYLAGIYTYAVLYLLSERVLPQNGRYVDLLVSYPNDVTLEALKNSWNFAGQILNRMMDTSLTGPVSTPQFYDEATATTAYHHSPHSVLRLLPGLVTLDIGGGTTDISITHTNNPQQVRNLSVRYAGRELMVSSLIEYFRHFSSGAAIPLDGTFSDLWKPGQMTDPEGTETLMTQFFRLCRTRDQNLIANFLHGLTGNTTVRMIIEMLLAGGLDMGATSAVSQTNLLRQLIALKFIMVMQMAAQAVSKNLDLWIDPKTGRLDLNDGVLEVNLSISGTSAQLLQYVFDCSMTQLNKLAGTILATDPVSTRMRDCMTLFNLIFMQEIKESPLAEQIRNTELHIYVDPDVKEKREVCYGMLQPTINGYAAAAKAAAVPADGASSNSFMGNLTVTPTATSTPLQARAQKKNDMQHHLMGYPMETFNQYLMGAADEEGKLVRFGLMHYIRKYEQIFFSGHAPVNRGLTDEIRTISDLLLKDHYRPYYNTSKNVVADTRAQYMIEKEQEAYLDQLACMYIVDEILDWEMADRQLS